MIANQVKGTGFRGTLNYLLGKQGAIIIGGNMLGETPSELSQEFSVSRALRPKLKRAVYHANLSLPHDEHLSTSQWKEAADKYVQKMGFSGSQYVVVKHNDTKHQHVHIVASRVRLDGSVVSDSQDYKRSEVAVRGLEKHFGLTPTLSSHEVGKKAPTKGELFKAVREQRPSTRGLLQSVINDVTRDRPDTFVFFQRLQNYGIEAVPNMAKTGHISGISFVHKGETMKGSDLGRDYTWSSLCKEKINYDKHDFNLRNYCQTQSRSHHRDHHWGSGQADRKVQNGIHPRDRSSVSTDAQTTRKNQHEFYQGIGSEIDKVFERSRKSKKSGKRNSQDRSTLQRDERGFQGTQVELDLSSSERGNGHNGENSGSLDLNETRRKAKPRRSKEKKSKIRHKGLNLDINF